MATTVAEPVFIDTNIIVYASRPTAPECVPAPAALARLESQDRQIWTSTQVLREYLAVVTRPQATASSLPMSAAIADIRRFQSLFEIAHDSDRVLEQLLDLLNAYSGAGKQVHDSNLVATMLVNGVSRLLTYNVGDFQRFVPKIEFEPLDGS
jgi:predicted nucleic acid-binding protein